MDARVRCDGDITIVQLTGRLDYESVETFTQICKDHLLHKKVVFNLETLGFVGSSGISPFISILSYLNKASSSRPKFCSLSIEYKKMLNSPEFEGVEIFESEFTAVKSFQRSELFSDESIGTNSEKLQVRVTEEPIGRAYPKDVSKEILQDIVVPINVSNNVED